MRIVRIGYENVEIFTLISNLALKIEMFALTQNWRANRATKGGEGDVLA